MAPATSDKRSEAKPFLLHYTFGLTKSSFGLPERRVATRAVLSNSP